MTERKNVPIYIKVNPFANKVSTLFPINYKGVVVPGKYQSDGLTKLINKYQPRCLRAAFVHDYICDTKCLPRKVGDRYFHEIMLLDSVHPFKARTMWLAVRGFALLTFKK